MNNYNPEPKEGKVASAIEEQTAKIPSDVFFMGGAGLNGNFCSVANCRQ